MPNEKHVIVLAPTPAEAAALEGIGYPVMVSGVGMAETAGAMARVLTAGTPDLAILAGIAGAVPGSGFGAGDSAVAVSETVGDLGAVRGGTYGPLFEKVYPCPYAEKVAALPAARFATVSCIGGPALAEPGLEIENMEGAAFFAACLAAGVPFAEVRTISNLTTDVRGQWRIPLALKNLGAAVRAVIEELL